MFERIKKRKDLKTPINIIVRSDYDYQNHDMNVLKVCLNAWVKNPKFGPFKFDWIYIDPIKEEKMYFVSTTKGELIEHNLGDIINCEIMDSTTYMSQAFANALYLPSYERAA